jgi:hypothetical protein
VKWPDGSADCKIRVTPRRGSSLLPAIPVGPAASPADVALGVVAAKVSFHKPFAFMSGFDPEFRIAE